MCEEWKGGTFRSVHSYTCYTWPRNRKRVISLVPCFFCKSRRGSVKAAGGAQQTAKNSLVVFESWSLWPSDMSNQTSKADLWYYDITVLTPTCRHVWYVIRAYCLSTGIMYVSVPLCWTVSMNDWLSLASLVGWLLSDAMHHHTLISNQGTGFCLGKGKPADDIMQLHGQLSEWVRWS